VKVDANPLLLGAMILLMVTAAIVELVSSSHRGEDPERARFMLECVADWQYTPETCERMLDGDLPPQRPDGLGDPGC
jgi:hypothetical protein